jgi:MFS family permease
VSHRHRGAVVAALGTAQTLSWASSYYLPAVLATPMAHDIGVAAPMVFAAFSFAMVISAAVGPWSGRAIDRLGGRPVLIATNLIFAAALCALATVSGPWTLFAAWALMGVAMGSGLYEAAFASLVRLYGHGSRNSITGITLIAGFASTIGWPLSAWMAARYGWRGACIGWALLQLALALPLNASLPRAAAQVAQDDPAGPAVPGAPASAAEPAHATRTMALLAFVFAATWFTSTAMAAHLPRLLEATGTSLAVAVGIGALVGPSQVAGRLLEFGFLRRWHPLWSARLAAATHPVGVVGLLALGPAAAPVFAVLHGMGNGILTIAKGTLPLALFGPGGYGQRQGWLMMPARIAQAAAPVLFGLALDQWGARAMGLTMGLGVLAVAALFVLKLHARVHSAGVVAVR